MKIRLVLMLSITFYSFSVWALGQASGDQSQTRSVFDQWYSDNALEVVMNVDMQEMMSNKMNDEYIPAQLTFGKESLRSVTLDAKVRARGRFRRMNCDFPPLKVKLDKSQLRDLGMKDHNDYKLVTHCADDETAAENLLREYLAYELYQELSPVSFRAQLVRVTYKDQMTGSQETHLGILLEDTDELAERLGMKVCDECYGMQDEQIQPENFRVHALFQYMIGNTDWSLSMLRNLKVLQNPTTGENFLAPYDFDFSGLVNAGYAVPLQQFGQTTVRDRVMLAKYDPQSWGDASDYLFKKKKTLINLVKNFDGLDNKARRDITQYLNQFYNQLAQGTVAYLAK